MKDVQGSFIHVSMELRDCFDLPILSLGVNSPPRYQKPNVILQNHSERAPSGATGKLLLAPCRSLVHQLLTWWLLADALSTNIPITQFPLLSNTYITFSIRHFHTTKMPGEKSKAEIIAERVANLPLPEDPPVASDWNSANANTVNVKAGERQVELPNSAVSDTGLEGAATKGSGVREADGAGLGNVGREGKDNLDGLPKDATKK
ncbi:hypothetical protein ONS95_004034 [Cadophora gregata]|uniref:uncharacterized protein n=1 Tax=Cadophora gregata TaxID=51156 RepID=UPI0026DB17FC|nr:uncharacterized protein ONS95_004034 [Cadophora gregata]KAK0107341.1 hypothetical protein ONS95_004034 [Cadophora gregata]KAK0117020.1 hypothetical protein ONS96_012862 [Cadophora gregata f. sp. sojae]